MLPSQTGRPKSSRSHMYRRTKRKRLPIIISAIIVILGAAFAGKQLVGSSKAAATVSTAGKPDPSDSQKTASPKAPAPNLTAQSSGKSSANPGAGSVRGEPPLASKPPKKSNAPIGGDSGTPPLPLFEYHPPSPIAAAAQPAAANSPASNAADSQPKGGSAGAATQ